MVFDALCELLKSEQTTDKGEHETMSTLGDKMIDSRDLEKELQGLIDAGIGQDADDIYLRKILRELKSETEDEGWQYGIGFIRDDYFENYARELAGNCGLINRDAGWPSTCIDWEQAARELQQDYTPITIDGVDYWYREA